MRKLFVHSVAALIVYGASASDAQTIVLQPRVVELRINGEEPAGDAAPVDPEAAKAKAAEATAKAKESARIQKIKKDLSDVTRHRSLYRARRKDSRVPVASLVGYTNAGKSTLLNKLTGAGVSAEDRLFSTLDPVTRRIETPQGRDVLLTDTVGFIQKLPTSVVAAFRATLEEAQESSLILHVLDITHVNAAEHAEVVEKILGELGLMDKPRILVLNKIDLLEPLEGAETHEPIQGMASSDQRAVFASAQTGEGTDRLLAEIDSVLTEVGMESRSSVEGWEEFVHQPG